MRNNYTVEGDIVKIELTQGQSTIVDNDPFVLNLISPYRWYSSFCYGKCYAVTATKVNKKRTTLKLHRLITRVQSDLVIDHRSGDGLDNRLNNLQVTSHIANLLNTRVKPNKGSGLRGVYFVGSKRAYAGIGVQGTDCYLSYSKDLKQLATTYDMSKVFLMKSLGLTIQADNVLNYPENIEHYLATCDTYLSENLSAKSYANFFANVNLCLEKHTQTHCYVYLATNKLKQTKVGYTCDISLRERELKRGAANLSDSTTTIFHYAELPSLTAARQLEAQLHKHFSAKRIVGSEFFNLDQHEIDLAMMYLSQVDRNNIIIDDLTSASN